MRDLVHDRIRGFLPQIQQANVLLETTSVDRTIESVGEDEEHVEMVSCAPPFFLNHGLRRIWD